MKYWDWRSFLLERPRHRWTEAEDHILAEGRAKGLTAGQIHIRLERRRTPDAVAARARYLREQGRL